jgi:hypothetical protein
MTLILGQTCLLSEAYTPPVIRKPVRALVFLVRLVMAVGATAYAQPLPPKAEPEVEQRAYPASYRNLGLPA